MTFADPRRYMRIADQVRAQIDEGWLGPGDQITRNELIADTGYSIHTVGHGLQLLEAEGLVRRIPGLGYYITNGHHETT
jgi:DNA-binding GntR family transcriptional regulator